MTHQRRLAAGVAAAGLAAILSGAGPVPAHAEMALGPARAERAQNGTAAACRVRPAPAPPIAELPWPHRWFGPERAWRVSRGDGVVVAVVDSGVDTAHPQLHDGQVLAGRDMLPGGARGTVDCDGHGTAVASIIAASPVRGIGFAGLAPRARLLPVRVAERDVDTTDRRTVEPGPFAAGIRWAADQRARVINLSVVFYDDHAAVADAVRYAQAKGALVVAAVGNGHRDTGPDATPYPAAYPGVVGVGALAADGTRVPASYVGPHVDLVAPGADVTAANPGAGHRRLTGTSFAAPFVSATLALLLVTRPDLSPEAAVRRLLATADPAAGPAQEYGHGVVNPYRALTERLTADEPVQAQPIADLAVDPAARERAIRAHRHKILSVAIAGGAMTAGILALLIATLSARGRRTGWAPTRRPEPTAPASTEGTVDDPAEAFFTVPRP